MNFTIDRLQAHCDEQSRRVAQALATGDPLMLADALARNQVYSDELRIETEAWEKAKQRAAASLYGCGVGA